MAAKKSKAMKGAGKPGKKKAAPRLAAKARAAKVVPCLWFDKEGEDAARFYVGIFKNSRIRAISRYPAVGQETHHQPAGSVMTVDFELDGQPFTALNAGPVFRFNEAISMQVMCANQKEIDYFWEKLGQGGDPKAQMCGWLKDKFGLSWQIVPAMMMKLVNDPDKKKSERSFAAMMRMKKLDIAALKKAHDAP